MTTTSTKSAPFKPGQQVRYGRALYTLQRQIDSKAWVARTQDGRHCLMTVRQMSRSEGSATP